MDGFLQWCIDARILSQCLAALDSLTYRASTHRFSESCVCIHCFIAVLFERFWYTHNSFTSALFSCVDSLLYFSLMFWCIDSGSLTHWFWSIASLIHGMIDTDWLLRGTISSLALRFWIDSLTHCFLFRFHWFEFIDSLAPWFMMHQSVDPLCHRFIEP